MASAVDRIDTNTPEMDHLLMIYGMASGSAVISKAKEMGIFELLYKEKYPVSVEELAKANKFKPNVLKRLLNCLSSLKVLVKSVENGKAVYANSPSGALLAESNPETLRAVVSWGDMIKSEVSSALDKIRITDTEVTEEGENWDDFDWSEVPADFDTYQGLHNILLPQAKQLVTHHDLSGYKTCYDLGGGTGVIAFELKRQYPQMGVTVVEYKNIVNLAKEKFIPKDGDLGVKFTTGDFFKLDFPGVDLFVIGAVFRSMKPEDKERLVAKCFQSLIPGGAVLALEQMQNEDKDGSLSATLWEITYEQMEAGLPTPSEYRDLFTKHGFTEVHCTLTQDWNDYDIIYVKKPKQ